MPDPLPTSKRQQIADAILAGLDSIWTGNGNSLTLEVEESSSLGNVPTDQKCVLVEVEAECGTPDGDAPAGYLEWLTTWVVEVYFREPPDSGVSPRTRGRAAVNELLNLLMNNYQWGGIVVDTLPTALSWFDPSSTGGAIDGFALTFTTRHRDPITNAFG